MKTILLPVTPMEAMRILNGKQTIIIRKSVPKDELPIKVWLYCSDSKDFLLDKDRNYFVWDKHEYSYFYRYEEEPKEHYFQKKVIASFTLKRVDLMEARRLKDGQTPTYKTKAVYGNIIHRACMDSNQLWDYLKDNNGKALYVSDLEIPKKPIKPSEFKYRKKYHGCRRCPYGNTYNPASDFSVCYTCSELLKVSRVHGPYMYVEEEE